MKKAFLFLFLLSLHWASAQKNFTRRDSLQGNFGPARSSYDVLHYDLNLKLDPEKRFLSGSNTIRYKILQDTKLIQLDLFENMKVDSIVQDKKKLQFKREFDAVFISFDKPLPVGLEKQLQFYYSGNPIVAKRAPWDGGFLFSKDAAGKPWIAVAVQGTGASLWYPCKDGQSDEPDQGANIRIAVPNGLMNVSNGRLTGSTKLKGGYTRWDWEVKSPINNYDITLNVADYAHIKLQHKGLDLDYYVLKQNEAAARRQFDQVPQMLDCFQEKFGAYPFAQDGYKLVETPYLGMEHQSAVAYGNHYTNGYLGNDLSGTGIGMRFDYIMVHESGHEWFGNSVTAKDIADMWIHEAFTMYSEGVFVECLYGYQDAITYLDGMRRSVANDRPVIGPYDVHKEGSGDMYYKGALMLNTLRHVISNDALWWQMIRGFAETYRHQIIDTQTAERYFSEKSGIDLAPIFNQYLRTTEVPVLELKPAGKKVSFRWTHCTPDFNMPVTVTVNGAKERILPTTQWQTSRFEPGQDGVSVDSREFFITVEKSGF